MSNYRISDSNPTLITSGAGYIGSHAVLALQEAGRPVMVLDDLSTGHRDRIPVETGELHAGACNMTYKAADRDLSSQYRAPRKMMRLT